MNGQKIADIGAPIGLGVWVISHIAEINGLLQLVLLVSSIIATVLAARYHYLKSK